MRSLSSATCFQNIMETIEAQNLTGLFAMETPFNSELIKQFYATLYVSGNPDDTATWILEWMIQGQVFRMHSQEFMEIVNIPRHIGELAKVHLCFQTQQMLSLLRYWIPKSPVITCQKT